MSGIFGTVRFGLDDPDRDEAVAMSGAMARWGDQEPTLQALGGAIFGHALRRETPEDAWSNMPGSVPDHGALVSAEGRLDNRDEVARALGRAAADMEQIADSTLMLLAYRAWGEACWPRLLGDWSMAVWDPREQRLTLARDHSGNTALFHHVDRSRGRVLFASDPRALIAAGVPRRLDEMRLAAGLISWSGDASESTIERDIKRIPPAHTLTITPDSMRLEQYWFAPTSADDSMTAVDATQGLYEVLKEAVRARCRGTGDLAVTLSGGLDSGSVTVLAAQLLGGGALHAYTSVPASDVSGSVGSFGFGDETEYAVSTAVAAGITDHRMLDSAHITPMAGVEAILASLDQPTHAASNAYWIHDILSTVRGSEQRVLLTGQGGNATISWTGRPDSTTLAGRWRDRGLRGAVGYLLPEGLYRHGMRHVLRRLQWSNTAIEPRFAARIGLVDSFVSSIGSAGLVFPRATSIQQRFAIAEPGKSRVGDIWSLISVSSGLEVRDPTLDKRAIDFTFTIPDHLFRGPDGIDRWVLRQAMAGLLPDKVRMNRRLGQQAAEVVDKLRTSAAEVDAALAEVSGSVAEEYVSIARMQAVWDAARQSSEPTTTHRTGSILLRGLMAALWLKRTHG